MVAALIMLLIVSGLHNLQAQSALTAAVNKAMSALTVEEKLALLVGSQELLMDSSENQKAALAVPRAWARTHAKAKPKIPAVTFADMQGGLCLYPADGSGRSAAAVTVYPMPYVLAASWNKDLLREVGAAVAKEALASGVDVVTAPSANVVRNPLSGRNMEYFSEDPVLVSRLASAMVKGMQSQGVQSCLKYWFIDHQEANRTNVNVIVNPRTLREMYMRPFAGVISSASPWGIMAAYPQVNGCYQTEDSVRLELVLRGKWNYDGLVVTDHYAGHDAVAQLLSGTDCLLPGSKEQYNALLEAFRSGKISEEQINVHVSRLLAAVMRTAAYTKRKVAKPDMEANARLAVRAAEESIVLLKNLECLPLDPQWKRVGFYGVSSYHFVPGNMQLQATFVSSLAQEFLKAGYIPDPVVTGSYITYFKTLLPKETKPEPAANGKQGAAGANKGKPAAKNGTATAARPPQRSAADQMALDLHQIADYPFETLPQEIIPSKSALQQQVKGAQFAIVSVGRMPVSGRDRTLENGYKLSESETNLIREVCSAYHKWGKKVIVILNLEGMVDVTDWQECPDAILYCGYAGQGGTAALADIMSGKTNPSGKLTSVWPKQYHDIPSSQSFPENYKAKPRPAKVGNDYPMTGYMFVDEVTYSENFRIGYRYFDEHQDKVQYPFGYGLSYTSFACDKLKVERVGDSVFVQVRISNTGRVAGMESVQLYVSPQRKNLNMEKPLKEMMDFAKTRLLKPEESQIVSMSFSVRDLASYDESSRKWVLSRGNYTIKIGTSSNDIRTQWPLQMIETVSYPE